MPRLSTLARRLAPQQFRAQLVLMTLGVSLVNFLLIGWYVGHDFVQLENLNTEKRFTAISGNLIIGATPLVIVKDYGSLETMLVAAARLPGVRSLAVTDARGRVLSRVNREASGKPRVSYDYSTLRPPRLDHTRIQWLRHAQAGPMRLFLSGNDTIEIWRPIGQQGLGWLYMRASARAIHAEFAQLARRAFEFLLLLFLSSGVLVLAFLRPSLNAMARATEFAKRLGAPGQEPLPAYRGNRELRDLGETLNETARKLRAQDSALRSNQERLTAILQSLSDGVVVLSPEGVIALVNPAFCSLFGIEPEQALQARITRFLPDLADVDAAVEPALTRYCAQRGSLSETVGRRADGEPIALAFAVNRFDIEGRTLYVGSCHDLRERNRLIGEIEQARDAAVAASRAKSDFLASMSHEIRTPMNGVIGMLELLSQSSLNEHQGRMAELSKASAVSLLEIINDILDHAKIEAGKLELVDGSLQPERCLLEVGSFFDVLAHKRQVSFSLFVDPALPTRIRGDELRMRQVATNLISNAIKFSSGQDRPGKVWVRAELASAQDGDWCRLSVADNGIGMEDATISRMFLPFEQADRFTTKRFGGTGLGLAICQRLVQMMGGRIDVASRLGEGTVFTVLLPLHADGEGRSSHGEELAGFDCTVHAGSVSQAQDVLGCLRASGAQAALAEEGAPAAPAARARRLQIWLGDEAGARQSAKDSPQALILLLADGRRRQPRRVEPNLATVDGNLLTRSSLVQAVRFAARIEDPAETADPASAKQSAGMGLSRDQALAQGRLVLVAEDNETNQQVIRLQLERLGWVADVVPNGAQALQRWEQGSYGLLLSDLHMPVMDGVELATAMRKRESQTGQPRTTIVALTAAAMPSELARALDAGMDDYLTKPVSLEELRSTLERWGARRPGAPRLDHSALRALVGDDPATLRALRRQYVTELEAGLKDMDMARQQADLPRLRSVAHRLKSASRTVGAMELGACLEQLERSVAEGAPQPEVQALVETVGEEAGIVLRQQGVLAGQG